MLLLLLLCCCTDITLSVPQHGARAAPALMSTFHKQGRQSDACCKSPGT